MRLQLVQFPPQRAHPEARVSLESSEVQSIVGVDEEMDDEPRQGFQAEDPEAKTLVPLHRTFMRMAQGLGRKVSYARDNVLHSL